MDARPPEPSLDRLLAHREWVRGMARRLAGNSFDADDLEQDAWLAAMRARPADGPGIRAWFARVLRNRRINAHRDDVNRLGRESASAPHEATRSTAAVVAEAEAHRRVVDAVLDLPSPFCEAVLLRYFEGLPPRDIATRTGAPVETVRTRLKRAAELLRTALGRGDDRDAWLGALAPLIASPRAVPSSVPIAGGLAMKVSTMLAAAAFLLAATGAVWVAISGDSAPRPDVVAQATSDASTLDRGAAKTPPMRRAAKPSAEVAAVVAPEDELPPPVDFAKVDRDLDLHGTVVDADGRGIVGARVSTVTYPWRVGTLLNARDYDVEVAGPKTRSARDGTFAMRLTRGQSVALRVAATGLASIELTKVAAGERIRIVLRPGVRLVVALFDASGAPVEGADVRLFNNTEQSGGVAVRTRGVTAADGTCTFDGLPPSAWTWIDPRQSKALVGWTRVDLPATGEVRKEIRLAAGRNLVGTVVDAETRRAVAGATVAAGSDLDMPATTTSDGTFVLPGWTTTTHSYPEIHVVADGYARASKAVGASDRLDFELNRGWSANGRVVADGRPVSGARVSVIGYEQVGRMESRMSVGHAVSDADGGFRITGLTCWMPHVLVVMADGFARVRREQLSPKTPNDVPIGDVALVAARRLEGVLLSDDGVPQPRVWVYAGDSRTTERTSLPNGYGGGASCFTDDLGRFRFTDVAPGRYTLTARSPAAPESSVDVTVPAGADLLDVKFRRMATRAITVTVVDSSRVVLAGAWVESSNTRNQFVNAATDATGVARLNVPSEVKARLTVTHKAVGEREFLGCLLRELRDDETDVTVVLEEAAFVTGRLVDESGAPVANAALSTFKAGESSSGTVTDDDGRFRVRVSREGATDLVFDGSVNVDGQFRRTGLYARADGVAPGSDVTLACRRVARDRKLTVVVVSPTGEPLYGAIVHVGSVDGTRRTVRTDASGRAEFVDLPAREVTVNAGPAIVDALTDALTANVVPEGQEIRLVCRATLVTTGKVVDERGVALPGGTLRIAHGEDVFWTRQVDSGGTFSFRTPADERAPMRLELDRDGDGRFETKLDGVRPGTQDVRIVATK